MFGEALVHFQFLEALPLYLINCYCMCTYLVAVLKSLFAR